MQNRREFLRNAAVAGTALLASRAHAQEKPPNIVLIISDDQAYGDYGFMGHPHIDTPRLDRLAQESLLYTRGYVTAPLCCPSLASMVTGLHPHQNGITGNDPIAVTEDIWEWTPERLQMRQDIISNIDEVATLPGLLGQKDYYSLQTGKWWLGDYKRGHFTHGMTHGDPERGGRHGDEGLKIGREGMEPITDFLDEVEGDPFFIWYAPFLPHSPHTPPERLFEKYSKLTDSGPVAKYWAMVEWFDETCGELLDILDERGLTENTMVLYVCDNGWIQDPREANVYAPRSKRSQYEGGIRTPIMVKWPGHIEPRRDDETPVSVVDLAPTILNACGVEPTAAMDGVDLRNRQALEARGGICGARYAHTALDNDNPIANIRYLWTIRGDWKLAVPAGLTPLEESVVELFNLREDPEEQQNLAVEQPERVQKLFSYIAQWWPQGAATADLKRLPEAAAEA